MLQVEDQVVQRWVPPIHVEQIAHAAVTLIIHPLDVFDGCLAAQVWLLGLSRGNTLRY